ncbi:MAG: recombinase family protein [Alphaproteobacteria bacterium]|nr:recombinase family protein [Alphaproteobacteria bacterium]MDD9919021.1 recombinase family protein [Alphaproteobacteria bacterium]
MIFGYARVSTPAQCLKTQQEILTGAGAAILFCEVASGKSMRERKELKNMLGQIKNSDVILVTRLDRLARSTSDLLHIISELKQKGAQIRSLAEPWADSTSPAGEMVLTVFAGIAQFERELIKTRAEEGRRVARANGVKFGRKNKLTVHQQRTALELLAKGEGVRAVARLFNVNASTISRLKNKEQ